MRKTFFALAAALLLAACAEKAPEKGALILGELTGFNPQDSIVVRLVKFTGGAGRGIARDTLQNGHFSLRLDSLYNDADFYSLRINEIRNHHYYTVSYGLDLYLEPGVTVRIKGDGWYIRTARVDSPVRDQILRESFMKKMSLADWQAFQKNSTLHNRIVEEVYEYKDNPWTRAQIDSIKALDKKILEEDKNIHNRIARQELKLLQTEEIGAFALRTLNSLAGEVVHNGKKEYREPVLRLYDRLTEEQKNSPYGIEILSYLNPVKEVFVGSPAPDVEYVDMAGKTVRLSDLRGKWILLDFWQRSCAPCRMAIPELGEVSREFQDRLEVVSISLDKESVWKQASEEHGIFWNNWRDPKALSGSFRSYGTEAVPTFVLISPEGNIEYIRVGYEKGLLHSIMALTKR